MPRATLTFPTLGRALASLLIDCTLRLGGGLEAPAPGGSGVPQHSAIRPPSPTFQGCPGQGCPYPIPDLLRVALAMPYSLGCNPCSGRGLGGGSKSVSTCGGVPRSLGERGVSALLRGREARPGVSCTPPSGGEGGQQCGGPNSCEARTCYPAGSGREKWAQMVLFAVLPGQGLGRRAGEYCGH